jgi:hypothetical protein
MKATCSESHTKHMIKKAGSEDSNHIQDPTMIVAHLSSSCGCNTFWLHVQRCEFDQSTKQNGRTARTCTVSVCCSSYWQLSKFFIYQLMHKSFTLKEILKFILKNAPTCFGLTLILLVWKIGWAPNNASKWQMGFNSMFKRLITIIRERTVWALLKLLLLKQSVSSNWLF